MKAGKPLKSKISKFLGKKQLMRDPGYTKLEKPFLGKARRNFAAANIMFRISEQEEMKKSMGLPRSFEMHEWVIIASYYSMYTSALAALARLGYKSRSHAATIAVLEYNYVRKGIEARHVRRLSKAHELSEELISKLIETKTKRETAQYEATPSITREAASAALRDAEEFITRIEEILQ